MCKAPMSRRAEWRVSMKGNKRLGRGRIHRLLPRLLPPATKDPRGHDRFSLRLLDTNPTTIFSFLIGDFER